MNLLSVIIFYFLTFNFSCCEKVFDINEKIFKFNEKSALEFEEKNSICFEEFEQFEEECEFLKFHKHILLTKQ